MEWIPDEKICQILCSHLCEEEEPNDEDDIRDFKTRWLANIRAQGTVLERKELEGFEIVTKKIKVDDEPLQNELVLVLKENQIVLLYMAAVSAPARLETLKNNIDSLRAAELLKIEPEEMPDWQELDVIE
jgi:hypothetical protein